ncbi:hypothetical protein TorRG33x02_300220 [Trema orientale]|uniref:Uncharacterized protein n=1 Tax=Trema orientale TaxID=63057 RepID=A0A2P5C2G3_TREOI|nr:hypothetical protein TorRG33x02_300220 [Trema orientale]
MSELIKTPNDIEVLRDVGKDAVHQCRTRDESLPLRDERACRFNEYRECRRSL